MNNKQVNGKFALGLSLVLSIGMICFADEIKTANFSDAVPASKLRKVDSYDNSALSECLFREKVQLGGKEFMLVGLRIDDEVSCALVTQQENSNLVDIDAYELQLIKAWMTLQVSEDNLKASEAKALDSLHTLQKYIDQEKGGKPQKH